MFKGRIMVLAWVVLVCLASIAMAQDELLNDKGINTVVIVNRMDQNLVIPTVPLTIRPNDSARITTRPRLELAARFIEDHCLYQLDMESRPITVTVIGVK